MRTSSNMIFALLFGAGAVVAGCNSSNTDSPTGSSQARVVATSQGTGTTTLHLTGTNTTDPSATAIDQTIEVTGSDAKVVDIATEPGTYSFTAAILSGTATLGTSTVQATLLADGTTQIAIAAQAGSSGAAASTVQIGVDVAPMVTGVSVQATTTTTTTPMTQVTVNANSPDGGTLTFYWSGTGIDGSVKGTDTMNISTATITAATSPIVHVVVQDATGASTEADIALNVAASGVTGAISAASASTNSAVQACLDAQAQCNAACAPGVALGSTGAIVSASCLNACTASLMSCSGG